jgi:hypothetical protein
MDLLGEFFIVERVQVEFAFGRLSHLSLHSLL